MTSEDVTSGKYQYLFIYLFIYLSILISETLTLDLCSTKLQIIDL